LNAFEAGSTDMVEQIVRAIEATDIDTIELRWRDGRVRIVQSPGGKPSPAVAIAAEEQSNLVTISAPLTGVFYARPAPDQPLFVSVADVVYRGQVVGLIETMKLFNEVVSEEHGRVREILVAEGDLVERDQPLIRLEPTEGSE
jgi:biotin carboxyl carrier protein